MRKFKFLSAFLVAALAAGSAMAMTDLKLGTGSRDFNYDKVGRYLQGELADVVKITPTNSKATIDNIERMDKGEFNAALVQNDGLLGIRKISPTVQMRPKVVMKLYDEYAHFLCNTKKYTDSRVTGLLDTNNIPIAVDSPKSGHNALWQTVTMVEPRYANVPTTNIGGEEALQAVISGEVACMVFVSGLNSDLVKSANQAAATGAPIKLLDFNDKDFFKSERIKYDGTPVYEKGDLPTDGNYRKITGYGSPSTLKVGAVFVVSPEWYTQNKDEYGVFVRNLRSKIPGINDLLTRK